MSVTPRRPLAVQPHPYIGDVVGRPLDRGMIYFGEPDKDPQDYPITVYLDPEQTKPAHQPIRTKGGFINVFGDITEIFADEILYSLKVLDCYGRLVFYKKRMHRDNITEELGGEIVRAQKAESALQSSIDAEALRAKKAESDLSTSITKEVNDRKTEVTRLDEADAVLQAQINSVGGGKLAYKTYAEMIADKSNIAAKSSIDIIADTDDKNGTYLYDGANFVKSNYDLEKLIRAKVQNTFDTYTQMVASDLSDGAYALVADDADDKNGLYVKDGGVWAKSEYDPFLKSKGYTDAAVKQMERFSKDVVEKISSNNDGGELFTFVDSAGNKVAEIKEDAGLYLAGFDGEVQSALSKSSAISDSLKVTGDLNDLVYAFTDSDGNILAGIDKDAGVRIGGTSSTVQEHLGLYNEAVFEPVDERFFFTESCDKYFMNLVARGVSRPPLAHGLLPQRYTLPDSIINSFTLTPPEDYIRLDTPYGVNDKVVHPYVVKMVAPFRGYNYLMCITPYTIEPHENPVIFGSKDSENWEMLTDMPQPLASPASDEFLSDNGLAYDPVNGLLVCYWRRADDGTSANDALYYRVTRDGITWTDKAVLKSTDSHPQYSPSVLFNPNDGFWHLWVHRASGYIKHYKSKTLNDNWEFVSEQFLAGLWHCEVKFIGDKYLLLNNKKDPGSNYFFAISADGSKWTQGKALFDTQLDALYKASFIPVMLGNTLRFDVYYTTNHAINPVWHRKFFKTSSNTINL